MKQKKIKKGFSLVEIIIASSILLISVISIFSAFVLALSTSSKNTAKVQAAFLLEEGNEALRNMRDFGFSANISPLQNNTSYRLAWDSQRWQATTTNTFIDSKFDRTFVLSEVQRDIDHNIVSSGGTVDNNTKKVTVSVSWRDGSATTTRLMESYVSNIFNN